MLSNVRCHELYKLRTFLVSDSMVSTVTEELGNLGGDKSLISSAIKRHNSISKTPSKRWCFISTSFVPGTILHPCSLLPPSPFKALISYRIVSTQELCFVTINLFRKKIPDINAQTTATW